MTDAGQEPEAQQSSHEPEPVVLPWRGQHSPATVSSELRTPEPVVTAAPLARELTAGDLGRRPRRVVLPVCLFVATCLSTFLAGTLSWNPGVPLDLNLFERTIAANWQQGLVYMACVIGILLTHEMGHFVQTLRYGVHASLPFFIPVPFLFTGTMGAVIGMEGSRADRKQLFDIGITGPIAGLIVALPIIWFGILQAQAVQPGTQIVLGDPMLFKLFSHWLRPDIPAGAILDKNNPLLMAGWVGMLITGLNMLPISQLDGGHVIYGLFGRGSRVIARSFLIAAILYVVLGDHYSWTVMLVIVILLGVDHPPTRDDNVELGWWRTLLGLASLSLPVLCFTTVLL